MTADETWLAPQVFTPTLVGPTYASGLEIASTAQGSGVNGPATAHVGLTVQHVKQNWTTTPAVGEIDGIYVNVRQGGEGSDAGGILINVQNTGGGFLAATEYVASVADPASGQIIDAIRTQQCGINPATGDKIGLYLLSETGQQSDAIRINSNPGSNWGMILRVVRDGVTVLTIDDLGNIITQGTVTAKAFVNAVP